jgi:gluconolactonase
VEQCSGRADRPGLRVHRGAAADAGRLTVCEPGNRRITRTERDGSITVLVDRYGGKRLNSPNDLVYRRTDGALYFTDPPTGLPKEDDDPAKELPFNGIYRLAGGTLQLLNMEMRRPNGIGFSPDGRDLYVSNADPRNKIWMRFEVLDADSCQLILGHRYRNSLDSLAKRVRISPHRL